MVSLFENLPSIVFKTPSIPLAGDRNLREEEGNRPTRCSEPLRYKVGGAKRSRQLCGMGPPGENWREMVLFDTFKYV